MIVIRSILSWFVGSLVLASITLAALLMPVSRFYPLVRHGSRLILWICGIKVILKNREKIDPQQSYLFMGNHVNIFDSVILAAYLPTQIVGVEKDIHFRWPVYGLLIKRFGNIPVSQANTESARKSIERATETLKKGNSVVILPEGTRTRTGNVGIFKKGGFHLAIDAKAMILPFTFKGAFKISQKGSKLIHPGTVELIFHDSIDASLYSKENLEELLAKVKAEVETPLLEDRTY